MSRNKNRLKYAAALSATGFTLNHLMTKKASAYSLFSSTTSITSFSSLSSYITVSLSSTSLGITTTVGGVVLILKIAEVGHFKPDENPGEATRLLIESGMIATRGDLGMELSLMAESPNSFKATHEAMLTGEGAPIDALSQSTGIPQAELVQKWREVSKNSAPVQDEASASRFLMSFLIEIGAQVQVDKAQVAHLLWQLTVEDATLATEDSQAHQWLSHWLQASPETVEAAVSEVFRQEAAQNSDLRATIEANPDAYLLALSAAIEHREGEQIHARVNALLESATEWLPKGEEPLPSPT